MVFPGTDNVSGERPHVCEVVVRLFDYCRAGPPKPMTFRIRHYIPVFLALSALTSWSQHRVDARHLKERMLAVVPLVGAGTYQDPKRPLFAPGAGKNEDADGIESFEWQPSDDGQFAIVEFVARDPKVLAAIATDSRVVKSFAKGKAKKDDIDKELKKYRKDFSFEREGKLQ